MEFNQWFTRQANSEAANHLGSHKLRIATLSKTFQLLAHFQALETSRPSSARPQAPVHGHSTPALSLSAAQHAVTAGSATSRSEPTTSPAPNPRGWRALSSRGFLVTHRRIFSAETLGHRRGRVEAAPGLSAPAGTGRRRGSAADAGGDLSGRRGALQRRGGAGLTDTRSPRRSSPAGTRTRARRTRPPRAPRPGAAAVAAGRRARAGAGQGPGAPAGGARAGRARGGPPARRPSSGRLRAAAAGGRRGADADAACLAGLDARGRRAAGAGAGAGPGRRRPARERAAAGLRGPARGAPGAAVRAAGGRRAGRLPPRAAAGAARAGAQRELPGRGQARRPPLPAARQPAQRVAVGLQDLLRPGALPALPARSLLPVRRLPHRAARRRGAALPQRAGLRARRGAAPHAGLRGGPRRLRRGVRQRRRGLHVRPRPRRRAAPALRRPHDGAAVEPGSRRRRLAQSCRGGRRGRPPGAAAARHRARGSAARPARPGAAWGRRRGDSPEGRSLRQVTDGCFKQPRALKKEQLVVRRQCLCS
ncbi:uncharacterized protein [Equus przewalskii]|uniref:Uncharacterized protein n=1 Tax=Equus przewalskii TaxID=9798 RepID=A0ABM4L541_EQUPR